MESKRKDFIQSKIKEKIAEGMKPMEAFRWVQINVIGVKNPDRPKIYR